jgi:selenocysteine lyase/cysteine desulfurase
MGAHHGGESLIDKARGRIAEYIGAQVEDVVFVDNASHGMNAVLRSLAERLPAEALVLDLSLAYTMVKNTLHYSFGDRVVQVNLTLTSGSGGSFIGDDGIVQAVRKVLETHKGAIKLLSVSHITSLPAIVLPVAELAALAHSHGALIVADGAHALGQITLDVPSLGVDFYVANGHKWLPSPKGSAVLWVARAHQSLVYPTTISQEGQGSTRFVRDFSYQGTDDPTAWLSMVASLDFRSSVPGGEEAVIDYVARLATEGGALLARMWKTELLLPAGRASLRGSMVNVRMPTSNGTAALAMNGELLEKYHTWVPCFAGEPLGLPPSTYWCRVSAFLYNNISDFEMLGDAVLRILARSPDEY